MTRDQIKPTINEPRDNPYEQDDKLNDFCDTGISKNPFKPLSEDELEFIKTLYPENNPYFELDKRLRELLEQNIAYIDSRIEYMSKNTISEYKEGYVDALRAMRQSIIIDFKPLINKELSLCPHCLCMTKTINNMCGKCKEVK
jgi:hypothetical protein